MPRVKEELQAQAGRQGEGVREGERQEKEGGREGEIRWHATSLSALETHLHRVHTS